MSSRLRSRLRQSTTSLRFRFMLLIFLLSVSTFLLVTVSFATRRQQTIIIAEEEAMRYARLVSAHYSQQVEAARQVLIALSNVPDIKAGNNPVCSDYMAGLMPYYPNFTHIVSFDLEGNMICASEPAPPGMTFEDSPLYPPLLATRDFVIGNYSVGAITQQQIIGMVYPTFNESGQVVGAVGVALDLGWVSDWLLQIEMLPETVLFVTDGHSNIIASNREDLLAPGQAIYAEPYDCFLEVGEPCPEGTAESDHLDGMMRVFAYTTLDAFPAQRMSRLACLSRWYWGRCTVLRMFFTWVS